MTSLSAREKERYSRHLSLPQFGMKGQIKLKQAKILVIGVGGLGSPALYYLAAAGIGHIGLIEYDQIDRSNLQRQILYKDNEIGLPKGEVAVNRLQELNPDIQVTWHNEQISSKNAIDLINGYDLVIDGTDNFPTRYLVNDACVLTKKTLIYGAIFRFEGQVSVFNAPLQEDTRSPNYRDLYPSPPPPGSVPSCAEGGVLGVLPGIIGSMQASEAIKVITGIGQPLTGRLFIIDTTSFETRTLSFKKRSDYTIEKLIDYDQFCGIGESINTPAIRALTPKSFNELPPAQQAEFTFLDVRQPFEHEIADIGGIKIPKNEIMDRLSEIPRQNKVLVYCRSGQRSQDVIRLLQEKGYDQLYNLSGGILQWAQEVDPTLNKY